MNIWKLRIRQHGKIIVCVDYPKLSADRYIDNLTREMIANNKMESGYYDLELIDFDGKLIESQIEIA